MDQASDSGADEGGAESLRKRARPVGVSEAEIQNLRALDRALQHLKMCTFQ